MQDKNVREVLEGAFDAIHGWRKREKSPGYWEHHPLWFRFRRFLDVEAYLDAAMMLVPEHVAIERLSTWPGGSVNCCLYGTHEHNGERWHNGSDGRWNAEADHPAIALATAALKAKEQP